MAYPPPPGISSGSSSNTSHPSLPARPPPSKSSGGFKPAFKPAFGAAAAPAASSYSSAPSYASAPAANYGPSYPSYSQHASPAVGGQGPYQAPPSYHQYPQAGAATGYGQPSYSAAPSTASYSAAPQIRNPFPIPGAAGPDYDPDMAMQIAQWQSAYNSKDVSSAAASATGSGAAGRGTPSTAGPSDISDPAAAAAAANAPPERKKTVVREGGGKKWTDDTLAEWDPSHLRLFVGNLAGEVTDDSLLKAFSRWKSVQKARVIRDKRTAKSKGYGFVAFSDADDFFQAAKEMNGKYIQSHPVVVRKANTEIKITNVKDKDHHNNRNKKNKKHSGHGGGGNKHENGGGYEPSLGPVHHHGVTKPGQKTKNDIFAWKRRWELEARSIPRVQHTTVHNKKIKITKAEHYTKTKFLHKIKLFIKNKLLFKIKFLYKTKSLYKIKSLYKTKSFYKIKSFYQTKQIQTIL